VGWTYWVANVRGDVPRDVAVRRGRYLLVVGRRGLPKCILRVYCGIALIACSFSRTRVFQLDAHKKYGSIKLNEHLSPI